jgi:predicted SnoaL-like aldol condensation-catalyzing enzyme
MSVAAGDGVQVAVSGVQNAPGTHAAVFSDAFLVQDLF